MAVLMIGATEREQIAELVQYAKVHLILFDTLREGAMADKTEILKLEHRKPGFERPLSQHITFPGGYRAAFSIEQQPAGLCSHLSISVEGRPKKGMMPNPAAVQMIAAEFGMPYPAEAMWMEEFEPGEYAINLVSLFAPTPEGNA